MSYNDGVCGTCGKTWGDHFMGPNCDSPDSGRRWKITFRTSGIVKRRDVRAGECFKYIGSNPPFGGGLIIECSTEVGGDGKFPAGKPSNWLHSARKPGAGCDGNHRYNDLDVELIPRWDAPIGGAGGTIAVAAMPKPSLWNGKCGRCGRGTYQGLMALEHEGGGCP